MKIIEHEIMFAGERLLLTNQRVLYWAQQETLILSDVHLGKAAHFRKNGIAMPTQVSLADLARLEDLLQHYKPTQVLIVGDLIHAGANLEVSLFGALTQKFGTTSFVLIKGNHDRVSTEMLAKMGVHQVYREHNIAGIHFEHTPPGITLHQTISGHHHPGVTIRLPTRKNLRLPCYVVSDHQIILPAFSEFTGLDTFLSMEKCTFYAFYENGIFRAQ